MRGITGARQMQIFALGFPNPDIITSHSCIHCTPTDRLAPADLSESVQIKTASSAKWALPRQTHWQLWAAVALLPKFCRLIFSHIFRALHKGVKCHFLCPEREKEHPLIVDYVPAYLV